MPMLPLNQFFFVAVNTAALYNKPTPKLFFVFGFNKPEYMCVNSINRFVHFFLDPKGRVQMKTTLHSAVPV